MEKYDLNLIDEDILKLTESDNKNKIEIKVRQKAFE